MQIKVRALHLAAYIKANGGKLLGVDGDQFIFESEIPISAWRLQHATSCCRLVDRELIDLRKLLNK